MKWLVLVRPRAEADIAAARDWYNARRTGLGDEFLNETARMVHELELNPEQPRLYYREFRRVLFRRFPYKLFYRVVEQRVIVFRVLHAKQDHPGLMT